MTVEIIKKCEEFVKNEMSGNDASHVIDIFQKNFISYLTFQDWFHVDRVRRLALHLAKEEQKKTPSLSIDMELVEISALMHDIADQKVNFITL